LKNKFGVGYRISIIASDRAHVKGLDRITKRVSTIVPTAILEDESAGDFIFRISQSSLEQLSRLIDYLEKNPEGMKSIG